MTERLYDDIAEWWPVISPPEEYAEEADLYVEMIRAPPAARCARCSSSAAEGATTPPT